MRPILSIATTVLVAVLLGSCVNRQSLPTNDESLVGCWRGEGYQPEQRQTQSWLTRRNPDGTFSVEFKDLTKRSNGQLETQVELGAWSQKANIYTTTTKRINGIPAFYYDEYEILELTKAKFVYRHKALGEVFTASRVSCEASGP
jgi:hypothetical protein